MISCSRRSSDPLLAHFLRKRVNLLDPPRTRLDLGTVFVIRGGDITDRPLESIIDGPVEIVERDDTETALKDFKETVSSEHSVGVGASVAGALLQALGFQSDDEAPSAAIKTAGADQIAIALRDYHVRRLDRGLLEESLKGRLLRTDQAHADGAHSYYVTTGTWSASTLELHVRKKGEGNVEAKGELKDMLSAKGKATVKTGLVAETLITSDHPLVFGVEVMRLGRKDVGTILLDRRPDTRVRGVDEPIEELEEISKDAVTFSSAPASD